jgi:hypothetical protein
VRRQCWRLFSMFHFSRRCWDKHRQARWAT